MTIKRVTKPRHIANEETRERVRQLASVGTKQEDIALSIGISKPTLVKYYRDELNVGMIDANAKVAQSLFDQATNKDKPNVVAAIFWLKARAGWRDSDGSNEVKGKKEQAEMASKDAAKVFKARPAPPFGLVK